MIRSMPGLEGLGGRRAGNARTVELDGDDPGGLVHIDEIDVTLVGLDGRPDDLDDPLHFRLHRPSLAAPGPQLRPPPARKLAGWALTGAGTSGRMG